MRASSSHLCLPSQLHLSVSEGISSVHRHTRAHKHAHKHRASGRCAQETSCQWKGTWCTSQPTCDSRPTHIHNQHFKQAEVSLLLSGIGEHGRARTHASSRCVTGTWWGRTGAACSSETERSRWIPPYVKLRSTLSCFEHNTLRNFVVWRAKTSAAAVT